MKRLLPMRLGGADKSPTLTLPAELSSPEKARHAPGGAFSGVDGKKGLKTLGMRVVSGGHLAPCFRSLISWILTV